MPIRFAENFRAVFYAPFYAAQSLGFYAGEGVEVELVTSSNPGDGVLALLNDTIDITWGGPMRVMKAHDLQSGSTRSIWWAGIIVPSFSSGTWRHCDLRGFPKYPRLGCAFSTTCGSKVSIRLGSIGRLIDRWPVTSKRCATGNSMWRSSSNPTHQWLYSWARATFSMRPAREDQRFIRRSSPRRAESSATAMRLRA